MKFAYSHRRLLQQRPLKEIVSLRLRDLSFIRGRGVCHRMTNKEAMALGAHCQVCPLKGRPIVPPTPSKKVLRLVIIGEGPGKLEENVKAPFLGMGGKILDAALSANGVSRSECHLTNTALCRGETDKENDKAAECCAPRMLREVGNLYPRDPKGRATGGVPLLLLGRAPLRAVLNLRSILIARGFLFDLPRVPLKTVRLAHKAAARSTGTRKSALTLKAETLAGRRRLRGIVAIPGLHPSFILRADTWGPLFRIDVGRACRQALGLISVREDVGTHRVGGLEVLEGLGPVVSCDIETDGIDPMTTKMLCVGVSDGTLTSVVWPWRKRLARGFSKWMRGRKAVVFHNGI